MNIVEILKAALKDESTFAEAEALYAESFKDAQTFRVSDNCYTRQELVNYLRSDIYEAYPSDAEDWFEPAVIKEGYSLEQAEMLVDHIEFVDLCNYKGEGQGFEMACRVQHLRTFHGKHNYS